MGPELHQQNGTVDTTIVSGVFRWLSNDPIGIRGGLNQYVFCDGNPVNFGDPFGNTVYQVQYAVLIGTQVQMPSGFYPYFTADTWYDQFAAQTYNLLSLVINTSGNLIQSISIDPNDPAAPLMCALAAGGPVVQAGKCTIAGAYGSKLLGPAGPIFGRGGLGILNNNPVLRCGWGWSGSRATGTVVFRFAWGPNGSWWHGHWDLFAW